MDVSFKTYETKFSTLAPLVDGYKFVLLKKNKTTIIGSAAFVKKKKKKCTKRISTDKDITMVVRADGAHNHAAESEHSIEKQDLQQRCKKRARGEPEEKASNIIINVLKKDPLDIMPNEFKSIRQSLYQERGKQYPKCPTSIEDTRTALESGIFNAPAEMVFAFRNDVIMVTFQNNFSLLNDRSLFGDGTFKSSPQYFYQLYTLHTENLGHYNCTLGVLLFT